MQENEPIPPDAAEAAFRAAIRDRDAAAWDRLAHLYDQPLRRQVGVMLRVTQDRDDVVGEVWFLAYRSASRYDPTRGPWPWLSKICARACLVKRRTLRQRLRDLFARPRRVETPDPFVRGEARRALGEALGRLRRRPRQVVLLRHVFGLSPEEIGDLLGMERKAVKQTLVRALTHMRSAAHRGKSDRRLEGSRGGVTSNT